VTDPHFELLCRMGDNALVLGHRLSEWCGVAPVLEEDIALANTALDLIGQARMWLDLAGETEGKARNADRLAFYRDVWDFRNLLLVEQPNGDFGQTMMRQFLFDAWHELYLAALKQSPNEAIAGIAGKAHKEVSYHLTRSSEIVISLGDGTAASHIRMQNALDRLYPFVGEMITDDQTDMALQQAGLVPGTAGLKEAFHELLGNVFRDATLELPQESFSQKGGKTGKRHSEHLGHLLTQMQWLPRAYPDATW
jgi:ring-1,2-phenylacetyl-CoA epoxidase subunit PaaC